MYLGKVLIDASMNVTAEYCYPISDCEYEVDRMYDRNTVRKIPRKPKVWLLTRLRGAASISQTPEGALASARMLLTDRLGARAA